MLRLTDICRRMEAFRQENTWIEQSALFSVLTEQPELAGKVSVGHRVLVQGTGRHQFQIYFLVSSVQGSVRYGKSIFLLSFQCWLFMERVANMHGAAAGKLMQPSNNLNRMYRRLSFLPQAWWDWPAKYRDADPDTMAAVRKEHVLRIDTFVAIQFLFDHFWTAVKVWGCQGMWSKLLGVAMWLR